MRARRPAGQRFGFGPKPIRVPLRLDIKPAVASPSARTTPTLDWAALVALAPRYRLSVLEMADGSFRLQRSGDDVARGDRDRIERELRQVIA